MVTDAIINAFAWLVTSILGLLPHPSAELSASISTFPEQIRGIVDWIANLSPLIPFSAIEIALRIIVSAFAVYLPIVGLLKALSLFTGGGGK